MALGDNNQGNRRFRSRDPEPFSGTPLSMQIEQMERSIQVERDEMARLMKDLVSATQRAEAAEARREEDQREIEKLRKQVDFFRERSVMMVQMASGLIATVRGLIPAAGSQVLGTFRSISDAVEKQLEDLTALVKDHMAGTQEFLKMQRDAEARNAGDRKHVTSLGKTMKQAVDESKRSGVRTLDQIEHDMQTLVSTREPAYVEGVSSQEEDPLLNPAPITERKPNGTT